jgi:hypothetical protein
VLFKICTSLRLLPGLSISNPTFIDAIIVVPTIEDDDDKLAK